MDIITEDMLAENLIEDILEPMRIMWQESGGVLTFDNWLWNNLPVLGDHVYRLLGDHLGGEIE